MVSRQENQQQSQTNSTKYQSVSISYNGVQSRVVTWSEQVSTALTSNNVVFDTCTTASVGQKMFSSTVGIFAGYPSTPIVSSTLKIYKYKTA